MSTDSNYKLESNVIIRGIIELKTGLHIGTDKDKLSIGGVDSPIIKDPLTEKPIIPGSSLKGKMRSLLEYKEGKYSEKGSPHASPQDRECTNENCNICVIFGSVKNKKSNLTRLIVRDSITLKSESINTEIKVENSINRIKGSATAPRFLERVPAGTLFDLELVYMIFNKNNDKILLKDVFEALSLVEDSYLGGSGTRGYGNIEFKVKSITVKKLSDYTSKPSGVAIKESEDGFSISEILQSYEEDIKNLI